MDQGYKHFSHLHNLVMHQMPEGVEVSCSGCFSSATGTVYVCWQCNFFLHDQCYRATRSLKHPSHPLHPLTLVPYPTYHSNSFYCNSCQIIGTGFSYSCADCEFDLHVQCAHSISRATSFKNAHLFQELVPPGWNAVQDSNVDHHVPFNSVAESLPIPFTGAQNHYMPLTSVSGEQYHPTTQDLASVPIPPRTQNSNLASVSISISSQNPVANSPYPPNSVPNNQDPSMPQDGHSVPIPMSSFSAHNPPNQFTSFQGLSMPQNRPSVSIPASTEYPSVSQTGHSDSIPTKYPQNTIPSSQDPSMAEDGPSDSIPTSSHDQVASAQNPSSAQTGASSVPTNHPNQFTSAHGPSVPQNLPSVSIPASTGYPSIVQTELSDSIHTKYPQDPIPGSQDPSTHQNKSSVSIPTSFHNSSAQYPSMAQTGASVSIPTNPSDSITSSHDPSVPQDGLKNKGIIMHFSHPHKLSRVNLQEDEEDEVICSGCEETLVGNGYSCAEPDCNFHLHGSCFRLKKEIHHNSHPEHPLTLRFDPYNNNGEFTCNACFSDGTGFTYHCSICKFDLHIQCVNLPETAKRDDHKHTLKLFYSCPVKDEEYTFYCDICHGGVPKERWVYYCEPCDYGMHLGCVDCEECERDSILDAQARIQRLQLQMEMARQQAQFMASMGSSLSSLIG